MATRHAIADSAIGPITLVASSDFLTGLYFPHHWYAPDPATFGPRVDAHGDAVLDRAQIQIHEYLAGTRRAFDVPLAPEGDAFQSRVWAIVSEIPYGAVRTYGEIAAELGGPSTTSMSLAQRVGQAIGRNPLCIFIPCHRVVGAGGKVTGYAGGRTRKRQLLELERPAAALAGRLF